MASDFPFSPPSNKDMEGKNSVPDYTVIDYIVITAPQSKAEHLCFIGRTGTGSIGLVC